jgi:iron complex outermembrane receptor protein
VDAGFSYLGDRWANTANTFKTPAVTTMSLGARSRFVLRGRPAEFRVLASNLTGAESYSATPTGLLSPIAPRTVRAMLTVSLRAKN